MPLLFVIQDRSDVGIGVDLDEGKVVGHHLLPLLESAYAERDYHLPISEGSRLRHTK